MDRQNRSGEDGTVRNLFFKTLVSYSILLHTSYFLVTPYTGTSIGVQRYLPPRTVSRHDQSPWPFENTAPSNEKPALCSLLPEEGRPTYY